MLKISFVNYEKESATTTKDKIFRPKSNSPEVVDPVDPPPSLVSIWFYI